MPVSETPSVVVCKHLFQLDPDNRRVITRMLCLSTHRMETVVARVLQLSAEEVKHTVEGLLEDYGRRHKGIRGVFSKHYDIVEKQLFLADDNLSDEQKLLVGACFTMEYAIESAALFNPSIVPHPDQSGLPENHARIVMSLRATGEGHVSSIEFRDGVIDEKGLLELEDTSAFVAPADARPDQYYDKHLFTHKLSQLMDMADESEHGFGSLEWSAAEKCLEPLSNPFTLDDLRYVVWNFQNEGVDNEIALDNAFQSMMWLARSNYEILFDDDSALSERVIFPVSSTEMAGIEDARFVKFTEDDGQVTFYATYTAYDGRNILTQLMETKDFLNFKVHTLNGIYAESKGMALFPRRVNGRYAMVSRVDGENLFMMYSDNIHFWDKIEPLQTPRFPWETVQIGNCGSPIETEAGWLMLTHGVGPMRRYCIGAVLLDLDDPSKIIGRLPEPILMPEENEREGYVPNVVYSCGGMIHNGILIIPYAVSDSACKVATTSMDKLLKALTSEQAMVD